MKGKPNQQGKRPRHKRLAVARPTTGISPTDTINVPLSEIMKPANEISRAASRRSYEDRVIDLLRAKGLNTDLTNDERLLIHSGWVLSTRHDLVMEDIRNRRIEAQATSPWGEH